MQTLLSALLNTVGLWAASRWRPAFRWDSDEIRGVMRFSSNLVGFNVFNYFVRNADNLLIGRFLGATELGYYAMAYRLMLWPLHNISGVVGRALFPVFSRYQADQNRLVDAYVQVTAAIAFITAPLMFGFFVLREPVIAVVLGERWQPVANILIWLAPLGFAQSIGATVGTLYLATGRTDVMFKWGIGSGVFFIPIFAIGLQWGITGVAAAYFLGSLLLFWPSLAIPYRLVGLQVSDVLLRLVPSIATAAVMAFVVAGLAILWPPNSSSQLLHLLLLILVGIVTYAGLTIMTQRPLLKNLIRAAFNR